MFRETAPTVFKSPPKQGSSIPVKASAFALKCGEGVGVAVDRAGAVCFLHRGGNTYGSREPIREDVILRLDPDTGELLGRYGAGLFLSPHGLDVDRNGCFWVTDVALNQVVKLSPEGRVLARYGDAYPFYLDFLYRVRNVAPGFPLKVGERIFARPTGVLALEDGGFLVTDGYRNNRLAAFNAAGELLWSVDRKGREPGAFHLPHGLARDGEGKLYVADRKNARIQVFSPEGKWLDSWEDPELGRPYGIACGENGLLYAADGGDLLDGRQEAPGGRIVVLDRTGTVLGSFGSFGENTGELNIPHDLAVGKNGEIYVAELGNRRLQKFSVLSAG